MRACPSPQSKFPFSAAPPETTPSKGGPSFLVKMCQSAAAKSGGDAGEIKRHYVHQSLPVVLDSAARKRKRHYWLLVSFLYRLESLNLSIIRLDLTTATGGDAGLLAEHFELLRWRIERRVGKPLHFWAMQTAEGNGVIHSVLASEGSLYVEFAWLRQQWQEIHGATRVFVKRYRKGATSRGKVSSYMVGQYMANQAAIERVSASHKRTFGFPVAAVWRDLKRRYQGKPMGSLLAAWHGILAIPVIPRCGKCGGLLLPGVQDGC